jgi:hyaluronoglucosaminidase
MFTLCDMTVRSLEAGAEVLGNQWAETLTCYLDRLDEACYHLKYRMSNLPLRQNLLPWIGALEDRIWLGRFALAALEAAETGANRAGCEARLLEQMETVRRNPERIGGDGVPALAVYAEARVREAASRPASRLDGISPADLGLAESERRPCAG